MSKEEKLFIFNFTSGGHNSVRAKNKGEVVANYRKMNGCNFTIDEDSIRELTPEEEGEYWDTFKNPDPDEWGKLPSKNKQ